MVVCPNMLSHSPCERKFAELFFFVADRESFDPIFSNLRGESGNGTGVKASTQKHAQRYIAHQVAADALFQALAIFAHVGFAGPPRVVGIVLQVPVRRDRDLTTLVQREDMA